MRLHHYLPDSLINYIKLLRVRSRYPKCEIWSHLVAPNVKLGFDCTIAREVELAPNVSIGDYSYVNTGTIIASGQIGKFCSIGYFCQIGMPDHPVNFLSTSPRTYGQCNIFGLPVLWDDYSVPPIIGHDVWIGSNALILQNVRVGSGAIIAGGSVVTKDVAPYTIVAGVPARPIRQRFDAKTIDKLLGEQWWDLPLEELRQWKSLFAQCEQAAAALPQFLACKNII
jgi:acetyltransferase-like isoleucine patch superfamily enzyme